MAIVWSRTPAQDAAVTVRGNESRRMRAGIVDVNAFEELRLC